jgi:hypothetical protein
MKILDTTDISSSVAMPIKSGTLKFIQDAYKESLNGLIKHIIETPITDTIYILSGCVNSLVAPNYNISAGVLYVNGEIFDFDGVVFTTSGLQKAYARIETTQYVVNADPVQFTDGVNRNVHDIRKIVIENTTLSSGLPEFKDFVYAGRYFKGETKEIAMSSIDYSLKFSGTGLGLLEYKGWAEMNGNNGTFDDRDLVVVGRGALFPTLGATGGSPNAVVVSHAHIEKAGATNVGPDSVPVASTGSGEAVTAVSTSLAGESGVGKNMQPYVVRLRIQKI